MNVFGVGPAELILILIVALVFVGPERLPRMAAELARTIREIRKYTGALAAEFNDVVKDLEKETASERSDWRQIGDGIGSATKSVTEAIHSARTAAEGGDAPAAATTPPEAETYVAGAWKDIGTGLDAAPVASEPTAESEIAITAPNGHGEPHANGASPATPVGEDRA